MSDSSVFAFALDAGIKAKSFTVESFSRALFYAHFETVQRWIDGRDRPDVSLIPSIAKALSMSATKLGLLYLMDCDAEMDAAVRDELRGDSIWPEVITASGKRRVLEEIDMSVDEDDLVEVQSMPVPKRRVIKVVDQRCR